MSSFQNDRETFFVPTNMDEAIKEIVRLRKAVKLANELRMKHFTARELDNRAAAGQIKALRDHLAGNTTDTIRTAQEFLRALGYNKAADELKSLLKD